MAMQASSASGVQNHNGDATGRATVRASGVITAMVEGKDNGDEDDEGSGETVQ